METDKPIIKIDLLDPAKDGLRSLPKEVRIKFGFIIRMVQENKTTDKFKKLTANIWEFKVDMNKIFYRLLAFKDGGSLIICTHLFEKEKNKTPPKEIDRAEALRLGYLNLKKNQNSS